MKRKLGTLCIVLGSVLILAALTLFLWNQKKEQNAEDAVKKILPIIEESIEKTDDLVIIAHNYPSHFGNLKNIYVGDIVCFKDMDGIVYQYEVAKTDVVESTAIEEVTNSGFSLTLLTCTYSGQNRIAVWCEKVN